MTSISAERDKLAQVGLVLRTRSQWGARFGDYDQPRAVDEPADHQFVHISITNPGDYPSNDHHARAIENIGIIRFPNTGISYNRLILPGGQAYEGQPIGRRGAHTVNDDQRSICNTDGCPSKGRSLEAPSWNLNVNGRSYCMARNCGDAVTEADIIAVARCLAADRLAGFVRMTATLHGHRCCSDKSCPCDPTWGLMGKIKTTMNEYLSKGTVEVEDMALTSDDVDKIWNKKLQKPGTEGEENMVTAGGMLRTNYGNILSLEAQVGALQGVVAEIAAAIESGGALTAEQVHDAAKSGAEEALQEGIDVKVTVDDEEPVVES